MRTLFLLAFLLGTTVIFADPNDSYSIQKVISSPTIDGVLSDWEGVSKMNYSVHTDGSVASTSGTAQAVWDDNAIYFAFSISDSDVSSKYTSQDDKLFNNDDLVEIFLDFDGSGKDYLELGVSAANINYDLTACPAVTCGGWFGSGLNGYDISGLETAVIVNGTINNSSDTDQGYIVEVKIPFSGLTTAPDANFTTPQIGTVWKGNVYSIDYNTGATVDQANDYLSWSTLNSFGFHQPSKFASFEFVGVSSSDNPSENPASFLYSSENVWMLSTSVETDLKIFSLGGKLVKEGLYKTNNLIDLNSLKAGIYFVSIQKQGILESKKIVIK